MLPLAGVKVTEFCQVLAGPFCGCLLADMGTDVVIENFRPRVIAEIGLPNMKA